MADITYFKKSENLEAKKVQWRTTIGRFLLEFASIEWFTYRIIVELPTERIFESTRSLPFRRRVALAIQLIEAKGLDPELTNQAVSLLRESVKLSEKRNILAHSPLRLNLFDDAVGPDLKFEIGKFDGSEAEVTYDELERLCVEVEKISKDLDIVFDSIRADIDST